MAKKGTKKTNKKQPPKEDTAPTNKKDAKAAIDKLRSGPPGLR